MLTYVGAFAPALPLAAAIVRRPALTPVRKWILVWCAFVIVANAVSLYFALESVNNHWLNYVATPVSWMLALWSLSWCQKSQLAAMWVRLLVPLLAVTWVGIVFAIESLQTFSLIAEPFAGLLVLGSAIYTLASRAVSERESLVRQDWLWIAAGLAIESGAAVALPPMAHWLISKHPTLVIRAYEIRGIFSAVALSAIARGVTCPTSPLKSGGSSSRASSRSPSSSSASSSRS